MANGPEVRALKNSNNAVLLTIPNSNALKIESTRASKDSRPWGSGFNFKFSVIQWENWSVNRPAPNPT